MSQLSQTSEIAILLDTCFGKLTIPIHCFECGRKFSKKFFFKCNDPISGGIIISFFILDNCPKKISVYSNIENILSKNGFSIISKNTYLNEGVDDLINPSTSPLLELLTPEEIKNIKVPPEYLQNSGTLVFVTVQKQ